MKETIGRDLRPRKRMFMDKVTLTVFVFLDFASSGICRRLGDSGKLQRQRIRYRNVPGNMH